MKISKRISGLSLVLVIPLIVGLVLLLTGRTKTFEVPDWRGITPGLSTRTDVVSILGLPDNTEERGGFLIDVYQDRQNLGWKWVEVWFEPEQLKVQGILLIIPNDANPTDKLQLIDLAERYRKPNFISWSTLRYERFFAWTDRGVAIEASISTLSPDSTADLSKVKTTSAFLFEPQSVFSFTRFAWPWPAGAGWNNTNLYQSGTTDAPDLYPENPIDWARVELNSGW
ncbi:MAG TPA: hypothetical protein PKG95_07160 [Anaerolineaceae bacterium]|nr:hypothetical protein [Anaerolineaceae bacterium]